MKKRYEVRGMMEWHPEFKVGRSRMRVSFTGGHLCGGASTPAVFETSDPVVQKVIESSVAYRSGRIMERKAMEQHGSGPAENRSIHSAGQESCSLQKAGQEPCSSIFEYSDVDDISDFLQHEKGVPLESMTTEDSCFKEAERLGIKLVKKSGERS